MRPALGGVALASGAVLLLAFLRHEVTFTDPDAIFWWFGVPLLAAALSLLLFVLPVSGKLALLTSLGVVVLLEGGLAVVQHFREPRIETLVDPEYYQDDATLGYAPKPGLRTEASKRVDGDLVYDVDYEIDSFGRRVTPVADDADRSRFLLFFGGSCTFGEGLEQHETLPYFVAQQSPRHRPYNYGFHGYGPPQLLATLESNRFARGVDEKEGALVYLFIDSHVNRAIGSMAVYTGWAHRAPHYGVNASGDPVRRGNLTTGRPLRSVLYSILGRSHLLSYFRVELPPRITERHVDATARIFARSAELFRDTFGGQRFVVVMFPGSKLARPLGRALDRLGVDHLDYVDLLDYNAPGFHIPRDWHPTARTNRIIARQLVEDLAITGEDRFAGGPAEVPSGPEPRRRRPRARQSASWPSGERP